MFFCFSSYVVLIFPSNLSDDCTVLYCTCAYSVHHILLYCTAGVCYRTLGRVQEAEHQFKLALALNPQYFSAVFNLGLTYQHLNRWDEAVAHFRRVTQVRTLYVYFPC